MDAQCKKGKHRENTTHVSVIIFICSLHTMVMEEKAIHTTTVHLIT